VALYWQTLQLCLWVRIICWYVAPPGECYYVAIIFHPGMWYHTLSVPYVYSKFGHYPNPLGYLCAKFLFFRISTAEIDRWRKIAYSPSLFEAPETEACALEFLCFAY